MSHLILVLWLYPLFEFSWMAFGLTKAVWAKHYRMNSGATEAIIQITTIGNYESVNEIIAAVRGYDLPFPYQFWVVVEPGVENHYVGADEVMVVPAEFVCLASYKARAQEYSRRIRQLRGLSRRDVKIFMLDDDSLPTREYFCNLFKADYDVVEGVLSPRRGYGRFLTHCDDLRTFNCMVVCSFWQGIGHPIWVHGEGLCLRGDAESVVTWNYPVVASEDFTVGQNSVEMGLKWGFMWEYVNLTSPFTWKDFRKQRRRWIWGNVYALRNGLIPPFATTITTLRWIMGAIIEILVTAALVLVPAGVWHPAEGLLILLYVSLIVWIGTFATACWIGSNDVGVTFGRRIVNTIIGTLIAPITSFLTTYVLFWSLFKGDPKSFEVIQKSKTPSTRSA